MATRPRPTDLSIVFDDRRGLKSTVFELGSNDVEILAIDPEESVSLAEAEIVDLDRPDASLGSGDSDGAATGLIADVTLQDDVAYVTVSGLTRAVYYELAVTFTSGDRKWTRTLFLFCPT